MKIFCPNCQARFRRSKKYPKSVLRAGFFRRKSDRKRVPRFKCKPCGRHFSSATLSICFRQKKRHLNSKIFAEFVSGVSLREAARKLKINRKTVDRKLMFLSPVARNLNEKLTGSRIRVSELEFDDMETFEHTKCKPLSITLAVEYRTRWILGAQVSRMPAKGLLTRKALKKYGYRPDERDIGRALLFTDIARFIGPRAKIKSDQNPHYPLSVKSYFPGATHIQYKGRDSCVVGQGELKKGGFDPLFSLNHTCAMMRAKVSRLIRKTWNTTKRPDRLQMHLELAILSHNLRLMKAKKTAG